VTYDIEERPNSLLPVPEQVETVDSVRELGEVTAVVKALRLGNFLLRRSNVAYLNEKIRSSSTPSICVSGSGMSIRAMVNSVSWSIEPMLLIFIAKEFFLVW
jgi:hypothetical protein